MRIKRPVSGKIIHGPDGMGVPSPRTVRERARELALIEGREKPTEWDWRRAFVELHGGHHEGEGPDETEDEMLATISERDMVAPTLGRQTRPIPMENEVNLGEELVAEGLDESAHDQMLQARLWVDQPESGEEET